MGARVNPGGAPAMMKRNSSRNAKEQVHMRSVQYSDRVQARAAGQCGEDAGLLK